MRRIFVSGLLAAACTSTALAGGCSPGKGGGAADAAADGYGVHVSGDAGGGDASEDEGTADGTPSEQTTMRLAHASPDLGPVDFCWRQTGTATFIGPVLEGGVPLDAGAHADGAPDGANGLGPGDGATDAAGADATKDADGIPDGGHDSSPAAIDASPSDDASADGEAGGTTVPLPDGGSPDELVFGAMSGDVLLPSAGTFDIAVVPAGQTTCVGYRFAGTVTLDAGKRSTVVLMGLAREDAGPDALAAVSFTDAPIDPETARVRMIHAALGAPGEAAVGPLSVLADGNVITPEVDPGQTSDPSEAPGTDALGYTTLTPLIAPTTLQLRALGDAGLPSWTTAGGDLDVDVATSHTGIIVSVGQNALAVAWCTDNPSDRGPACSLLLAPP